VSRAGTLAGDNEQLMALRIELIDDDARFAALEPEWNDLVDASTARNIFLTWEWVALWWQIYGAGSRLHVLAARDEAGTLLGLAPLKRRPIRVLGVAFVHVVEFLGTGGDVTPERLDFIIREGHETSAGAALVDALFDGEGQHGFDLRPFASNSAVLPFLRRRLRDSASAWGDVADSACPVMALPATREEFLESRSRNYRKKMGEYQRRCARDYGASVRLSATPDEVRRDMDALVHLHRKRWEDKSRSFKTARYIEFHHAFAQRLLARGWIRLFVLESSTAPLAVLYCFAYGDRYYYYQAGRDPEFAKHRVGLVIMHHAMEQAIAERVPFFDFLSGREDYKYMWAAEEATSVRLSRWRSPAVRTLTRIAALAGSAHAAVMALQSLTMIALDVWQTVLFP
jgi:CelD/BcsL family acetyltransferase involved in cellulose biosynthesis